MSSPKRPDPLDLLFQVPLKAGGGAIAGFLMAIVISFVAAFTPGPTPWQGTAILWGVIICVAIGAAIPVLGFYVDKSDYEQKMRELALAEQARLQQDRERHLGNQKSIRSQLDALNKNAVKSVASLNGILSNAEKSLDAAQREFNANVYSYFWREIEHAVQHLGTYKATIDAVRGGAQNYESLASQYEGAAPGFAVTTSTISSVKKVDSTIHRMDVIVRQALKKSDFAFIYEQRRTSSILVAGFANLAQALDQMSSSITSSISSLATSVKGVGHELKSEMSRNALHASMDAKRALDQSKAQHDEIFSKYYDVPWIDYKK